MILGIAAAAALVAVVSVFVMDRVAPLAWCVRLGTAAIALSGLAVFAELSVSVVGWWTAHAVGTARGLAAGALLVAAGTAGGRFLVKWHAERRSLGPIGGVVVVDATGPVAFAVPGRHGGVVLGREMVQRLDGDCRSAVLAHELAHLDDHHHRYLFAVDLVASALPFVRAPARRIHGLCERWADEVAAERVGSRSVVARAIIEAALLGGQVDRSVGVANMLGDGAVLDRVEALRSGTPPSRPLPIRWLVAAAVAGSAGFGAWVPLGRLATLAVHLAMT